MFGRSPPNILATLIFCFLLLLLRNHCPVEAKPHRKPDSLRPNTAGNVIYEGDWPEVVNYKNGRYKRSPLEVEDEQTDSKGQKTLSITPGKRQGIETPIQPLTSDHNVDLSHLNSAQIVRSKVDQPESESSAVSVEEEKRVSDDSSGAKQELKENDNKINEEHQNEDILPNNENMIGKENKEVTNGNSASSSQDEVVASTDSQNKEAVDQNKNSVGENKASADENAQLRSVANNVGEVNKLENIPNDKSNANSSSLYLQLEKNQASSVQALTKPSNKQQEDANESKSKAIKTTAPVTSTSASQITIASPENSPSVKPGMSPQESSLTATAPQVQSAPVGPVRDALGNSGSEIVTTQTRRAPELDTYTERDNEPKPSNGPEVGHFQVDDKSADLEINANSAGVKVKAKPASLQVVSRPGSHSGSGSQERSYFPHYHYPPYHPHHHWFPGMRRSLRHFHRRHFFNPYSPFLERRGYENFYDEAPFYRRRLPYWYPHRHRHHFRDSDLYERSRLEEPDDFSRYPRRRRHKRRFRHMNRPYRRQFYNNIPISSGINAPPQMGVPPEEGTMPQLPLGLGQPFTQRQNIITPMPAPINVEGNPPPGLLEGMNRPNFAMNGNESPNNVNGMNEINNAFNGMNGMDEINSMGAIGLNPLGQMGTNGGLQEGALEEMANAEQAGFSRALGTRYRPSETPRRAFKKTAILSGMKSKNMTKTEHSHEQTFESKTENLNENPKKSKVIKHGKKGGVNLKKWGKTLKRYHGINAVSSKSPEKREFRRSTKSLLADRESLKAKGKTDHKHAASSLHAQHAKDEKGKRKNEIVMHRPPIIYHPPPEIYHRPDIVVHRAPIMLHRPPIIYHQPPVVVHRPAIIYHQPPIVFHQPPPMVHQPILHSHDTWVTKPVVFHTASTISHEKTYYGMPNHVFSGAYGDDCHGGHCSFRKGHVPHGNRTQAKGLNHSDNHRKKTKRNSLGDYMGYFTSLWKRSPLNKRDSEGGYDFISSSDGARQKLSYTDMNKGAISRRDTRSQYSTSLNTIWKQKVKRNSDDSKNGTENKKKKDVVVNRPPIIYHPPPEIYHRPDIVVHRPPLVIHRPPIIYHQPPVIVHRPAVVYHQPPIVFHQPPPAVSQPLLYSHDSFTVHPTFFATHHGSVVRDFGHYVGVPNVITNYGNPLFGRGPIGKRSEIEKKPSDGNTKTSKSTSSAELPSKKDKAKNESSEKAGKKNTVLVHRPPIIYHPPPEIYHRPIIVVHRPPIMIHRAPIFYHQPPVVVHRPAIVYHQPPLIFHQPPPMVHQPVLKSHDTWISKPVVIPFSSRVMHHHTYVGVPDAYTVHHFEGSHGFYKSRILKHTHHEDEHAFERNKIASDNNSTKTDKDSFQKSKTMTQESKQNSTLNLKTTQTTNQKGKKKNAVIVRRPPVIYHPPPEIYHRPDIVVHRAPIIVHRAPIVYHQPPVIVHRPAIVYHQPSLIFHQPPPVVHQPIFRSHDTYVHSPVVRLFGSRLHHVGHIYHIPHAYYHGHGGALHYMAYGKSKVPKQKNYKEEEGETRNNVKSKKVTKSHQARPKHKILTRSKDKTETGTKLHKNNNIIYHKAKEVTEKANKKNSVVIHRPPIIYHPPPEVYHRPDIVVHRAPIVLYRAPIVYHQPPVVVHRPAIVYHQPPIVFHQPPPMVHQPVLHSHDTWVTKPVVFPYASHVRHVATYRGVPHEQIFMHGIGTGAFGKSHVPVRGSRRNEIKSVDHGDKNKTINAGNKTTTEEKGQAENLRHRISRDTPGVMQGKKRLDAEKRIRRAIFGSVTTNQLDDTTQRSPVGAEARIQRSLVNALSHVYHPDYSKSQEGASHDATRSERSFGVSLINMGAGARIQRAVAEPWTTFEGELPYPMFKRSSDETEKSSTPDENANKNSNSTKKTLLIIHRPPILYHPPSHMIHRPSIVVHRPDIIVHRHPIVFHRPPILVHRPPIIIHRQPVLIHRPPIIVHRPPLVFHRPSIIIHRRPYIIHHHPIIFHRAPIIIHRGPQMIVHHSHLIHHYPMHMIHMTCPGCGFGKSTVARLEGHHIEHDNDKTSHSDRLLNDANVKDPHRQSANPSKRSVADKKTAKHIKEDEHHKKRRDGHKKKKDVVVNRPPIIYHPPPEVYHRPDIVVHRAPILIHRPPIVYHQPPVVVHRPAVVYHQPPIVFHQPAPAVNQPLLYSHDSFVLHPMAFASHMGSIVNDAGHYVGVPHGGISNYPGNILHSHMGHALPFNPTGWSRRAEVSKPQSKKDSKVSHGMHSKHSKRSADMRSNTKSEKQRKSKTPVKQESKQRKGERKNKVVVARPPMIYHPPPEIYDQPDVIVHRPDIIIHRPSIVYHQPSVVVHRAPVVYQQPPVVFHQPPPMVNQPVYHAHDTYVAHPVYQPEASHVLHSATYVGAPQYYPGHNSYGWGLPGHVGAPQYYPGRGSYGWGLPASVSSVHPLATTRIPGYVYQSGSAYPGFRGFGYTPSSPSYGNAFGRSEVENHKRAKTKKKDKIKAKTRNKERRRRRSVELNKRSFHHHHHHHNHHHHHHGHDHRGSKRHYHFRPISSFAHLGHRKHIVIIHRPPLIYRPPPQVYRRPDILMHLPPLVYHRPALMFQQPPTVVHHPPIVYHQPPVVFHNPPSIVRTPIIRSHELISPHLQHIMVPTSSYVHPSASYFGPVVPGQAYGKSDIERTTAGKDSSTTKRVTGLGAKSNNNAKAEERRDTSTNPQNEKTVKKGSKKQNVDLVVHQPPIVYHPPPDVFDKPPVVMHQPPMVVRRPPILIHRAPVVVHRPPVIIHRPPLILHQPAQIYRVHHGHFFYPMRNAFGKSKIEGDSQTGRKDYDKKHRVHKPEASQDKEKTTIKEGQKKNTVFVHRPPMIYHPPPEIYDRPDVIVHRPDIIIHRPSIVYHQPSVVVHRPPIIYRQPPVVFHQPPPMVHQPVLHTHDTYLAHHVPVPYTSHVEHSGTYVGAPHFFNHPFIGGYVGNAFGKSKVEKSSDKTMNRSHANKLKAKEKSKRASTLDADHNKTANITKASSSSHTSPGHKKNKVIINRPAMIYHPPPEIYDRPDVIVHRPDIIIHRPSIVYHQPSVVVHRPAIVYRPPTVIFHQPPPLVNQRIMHAHDTYVAHTVPVPHSSYIQDTSTYFGSPHYYPGGWNYGWSQPHPYGLAYGKSKVPATKDTSSKQHKSANKNKVKRSDEDQEEEEKTEVKLKHDRPKHKENADGSRRTLEKETKEIEEEITLKNQTGKETRGKKKNLVVMHRTALIYHPPPEIYDKPDVIVHRPDIVIHRPSVVFHQPSVVVHRPPVIYQQPPVIFHQPSPMVHQPILHAHDTYVAHPHFVPFTSHVQHTGSYVGAPHFYPGMWGYGQHGFGKSHIFGKSKVEGKAKNPTKSVSSASKNEKFSDGDKRSLPINKNSSATEKHRSNDKVAMKGHKKNLVVMHRPPLIYHPPPEIYHKPDIILHRPDIVIHRPSVVFHQPSVVVHRPPVIYRQPPVVFHQPSPMVHQPILHAHDTYVAHPHFVPYLSHVTHGGSYVGAPHFFPSNWGPSHGFGHFHFGHAFGKSKVEQGTRELKLESANKAVSSNKHVDTTMQSRSRRANTDLDLRGGKTHAKPKDKYGKDRKDKEMTKVAQFHPEKEHKKRHGKGHKKNMVLIQRPSMIYHPPPEIYDKPDIIVHRPDVIIHQPSIVYHQPSVVVHRPPIIYHPPPVVFHQPPPMVRQQMYTSHDVYRSHPYFVPFMSHINHAQTYFGAPNFFPSSWGYGYGYGSSLAPIAETRRLNALSSPFVRSSSYGSSYIAPSARVNGMRGNYRSAFTKSNVMKHERKAKDSKRTRDYQKKENVNMKPHHHSHKQEKRHRRSVHLSNVKTNTYSRKNKLQKKGHKSDKGGKKNVVILNRPSLVYHPPAEIYHKPDIIMHRPDVVIHQPSVVYHQPSVVVHRPPIIYRQPPVVFHQPAPMVSQPIFHSHEHYIAHSSFVPYTSHVYHSGSYLGAPDYFSGGLSSGYSHAFGKSHVLKYKSTPKEDNAKYQGADKQKKEQRLSTKGKIFHAQREKTEKASRKNDIVVSRPPIIYHPPPEIYHRPDIVVHRAPIVLHRPPIIYHQPPVVVHRPAVVYHQPPVVFHQPPPTVNQPILHSHDSFVVRPAARFYPQGSSISHSMSYVGIPSHVLHGDDLGFEHFHNLHRSRIEHNEKGPLTAQMTKSTISKIPTTNKENTGTTITDQTQKKTLRSTIRHPKITKRQLIGSHSMFEFFSPINNVQEPQHAVEQDEKLSTIPGEIPKRENDIAKRQLILPEPTENDYHPSLPSAYSSLQLAALQNQAFAASEGLGQSNGIEQEHMADLPSYLPALQGLERPLIERLPFPVQAAPKYDSPDVRVHVETTKSSIPIKSRKKRQLFPIYQQQEPPQVPHVLIQTPRFGELEGAIHSVAPASIYNLLRPIHSTYHPIAGPYNYLGIAGVQHRPRVNINVQSARSVIPDIGHDIQKRSDEKKTKRQFLAVIPPLSPRIPFGLAEGMMNNYPSYLPIPAPSSFPYPLVPQAFYPEESEEDSTFSDALPLPRPSPISHAPYNPFSDDDNESPEYSPLASYLTALYNGFLRYPFYRHRRKPKVNVEVHTSKSNIPKAKENIRQVHSRISKRQLDNILPGSTLTENHYAASNYGIHPYSSPVSINVGTSKRNKIPETNKQKRFRQGHKLQAKEERNGEKRDQLMGNGAVEQDASQDEGNYINQPDNQVLTTNEATPTEEFTTSNENDQMQELPQQQSYGKTKDQIQEQQPYSVQQTLPFPNQPTTLPLQAQQLAYTTPLAPMQIPPQVPMQTAVQAPPYMAPSLGVISGTLPAVPNIPFAEHPYVQQVSELQNEQPKHTSINVNVAAKSTVPVKKSKKSTTSHAKRQSVVSPQGYISANGMPSSYSLYKPAESSRGPRVSISVQSSRKATIDKGPSKRQSISLLTRFPAMQVLPQTFKQNGVLMPAFNTLPINHRIKANGMLLEELQRQRKHRIPKTAKNNKTATKENAKKRQFYVEPALSPLPIQQYTIAKQPRVRPRPRVSVNVEVNKRKFVSLKEKPSNDLIRRQVYGMEQLPNSIQIPVKNPLLSQTPSTEQQRRVSVNVEVLKKSNTLLKRKDHEPKLNKEKRQIYGLSELPHDGLIQQPLTLPSQSQPFRYLPSSLHSPHVSISVETSKRSDGVGENIYKRQVLSLQPDVEEPFDQAQEPLTPGQETFQSDEEAQPDDAQTPIEVQEQSKADETSPTAVQSNILASQRVEDSSSEQQISRGVSIDNLDQRPHVSVHVEASKRGKGESRPTSRKVATSTKREKGDKREFLQVPTDYQSNGNEQQSVESPLQQELLQQQQQVSLPQAYAPLVQQQQVQQLQPIMLPDTQSAESSTRPKVSINVETSSKSSISKYNSDGKRTRRKERRQLLSTIPLLSSLGQAIADGQQRRSTVLKSLENHNKPKEGIGAEKKDRRQWKRQLYSYLGGQQEQQILPTQAIQDVTGSEQQLQNTPMQPVQMFSGRVQEPLPQTGGVPQPTVLETSDQQDLQQYQTEKEQPGNNQEGPISPIQVEPTLGSLQRPHVSINVQTAKSQVPNRLIAKRMVLENTKFKRQFDVIGGGGVIERRRGPKFMTAPLKKPRIGNVFGLGNNQNKPVEVFSDPLANLLAGGNEDRKRPKLGGIRLDNPTGVGPLQLKGAGNPLDGLFPPGVRAPTILQDNGAEAISPFVPLPALTGKNPIFPPSGIAGPRIDGTTREDNSELPLNDLSSTRPAIIPLPTLNQAIIPNVPLAAAAPPLQERPILLAPQVLPIVPLATPMPLPPSAMEDTAHDYPAAPQIGPIVPPVLPVPFANVAPPPSLQSPDSLLSESDEDKASVHVNVETSRSNVPDVKKSSKKATGPAAHG